MVCKKLEKNKKQRIALSDGTSMWKSAKEFLRNYIPHQTTKYGWTIELMANVFPSKYEILKTGQREARGQEQQELREFGTLRKLFAFTTG